MISRGNYRKELFLKKRTEEAFERCLFETVDIKDAERTEKMIKSSKKGAPWKVEIAKQLRTQTTAGNGWIAKRLNMGHPSRVTNLIREVQN